MSLSDRQYVLWLACVLALGVVVRAIFVFSASFPLNDGGMFYSMARDLQANGYRMPAFTSYNASHIPFAYPPLALYVAALLDDFTPLKLLDAIHFLPLVFSTGTIVAFYLLARDLLKSRVAVLVAVLFFEMLPPTITWMIMGGGLTRALGFFFALLTIREVRRMYRAPQRARPLLVAVLAALAVLSHIEMGWLACITAGVWFVAYGRSVRGVVDSTAVAVLVTAFTAPWWGTLVAYNGISPLISAAHSTGSSWWSPVMNLLQFDAAVDRLFDLTGALALLGVLVCLARRQYILPAWIAAVAVFDQRAYFTSATVALALLAAVAVDAVVLPFVGRTQALLVTPSDGSIESAPGERLVRPPRWLPVVALAALAIVPAFTAVAKNADLVGLSPGERTAMSWARDNTSPSSRFLVITGAPWPIDRNSEWFPALTGRQSVATVQGYEWLPGGDFNAQRQSSAVVEDCAARSSACLATWSAAHGADFDYVYVANIAPAIASHATEGQTCCAVLRDSLLTDAGYRVAYDGPGATIFARVR